MRRVACLVAMIFVFATSVLAQDFKPDLFIETSMQIGTVFYDLEMQEALYDNYDRTLGLSFGLGIGAGYRLTRNLSLSVGCDLRSETIENGYFKMAYNNVSYIASCNYYFNTDTMFNGFFVALRAGMTRDSIYQIYGNTSRYRLFTSVFDSLIGSTEDISYSDFGLKLKAGLYYDFGSYLTRGNRRGISGIIGMEYGVDCIEKLFNHELSIVLKAVLE